MSSLHGEVLKDDGLHLGIVLAVDVNERSRAVAARHERDGGVGVELRTPDDGALAVTRRVVQVFQLAELQHSLGHFFRCLRRFQHVGCFLKINRKSSTDPE